MNYSKEISQEVRSFPVPVPKEIIISMNCKDENIFYVMNVSSTSITPQDCDQEEARAKDETPSNHFSGGIVSLPSCEDGQSSEIVAVHLEPLDYRKDWSNEVTNDISFCLSQNPSIFMDCDDEEDRFADDNSLYSIVSEDVDMRPEYITNLWDNEGNDERRLNWVECHDR
mmetsp:Transcript_14530/g.16894  ORF Transcript_14530/g.16894 Transcript_14530/m.16894 type:complete len:170 (+) Transcript_14530:100-609(+)